MLPNFVHFNVVKMCKTVEILSTVRTYIKNLLIK